MNRTLFKAILLAALVLAGTHVRAGAQVTFCEDEVGHKVSASCLRALKDFFADP